MNMPLILGIEKLKREKFSSLKNRNVALLSNPSSIDISYTSTIDIFMKAAPNKFSIKKLFGPQQGIFEVQQANMIEWEGFDKSRWGIPTVSLYGKSRVLTAEMLEGIDTFVVDLQDIGAKGYTFISTLYYVFQACSKQSIKLIVLDRPNPLGRKAQGPVTQNVFKSFVGIHNLPLRHGLTIAEVSKMFKEEVFPELNLEIVKMERYKAQKLFPYYNRPWIPVTPNLPTFESVLLFPGMELLEGTNISEGRGTTRPFEQFGAPFIDAYKLCKVLNGKRIHGAFFRPISFTPTFDKFNNENCYGAFIHITNPKEFCPAKCALEILTSIFKLYAKEFSFNKPPYEYEEKLMPFDILAGNSFTREAILNGATFKDIEQLYIDELNKFKEKRQAYFLYK